MCSPKGEILDVSCFVFVVCSGTKKRTALPEPLTVDDESLMRVYYENLLLEVCKVLQLPHTIKVY
jgi:hypothetical protein